MGLLRNGIYGYKAAGNATLLGSRLPYTKNFATNTLTWENNGGANNSRERVSFPSGLSTSAFYMPLKDGGMRVTILGGGNLAANIQGPANLSAVLVGGGSLVPPTLFRARSMSALLTGSGNLVAPQISAIANMRCVIRIGAYPSAQDNADAVWSRLAANVNQTGTMGKVVNDIKNETGLIPGAL